MSAVEPRPAATVIVVRRGSRHGEQGVEALMVQRNPKSRFMPGVWVFPGGAVGDEDRVDGDDHLAHVACAIRELREETALELGDAELVAWSRWITPEPAPIRFDTRFYVALAPPHAKAEADGGEVVDLAWLNPARALASHEADELELVFPTIKHLESLLPYATVDEVIAAARERTVEPILPRVIGDETSWRVVLPGEPEY
jgi:8-oxo-dGTP pyrophosphatase MutT (NUDIX family)